MLLIVLKPHERKPVSDLDTDLILMSSLYDCTSIWLQQIDTTAIHLTAIDDY